MKEFKLEDPTYWPKDEFGISYIRRKEKTTGECPQCGEEKELMQCRGHLHCNFGKCCEGCFRDHIFHYEQNI